MSDDINQEMFTALVAYESLDEHVANCEDCCEGIHPELCEAGFPFADDARLKMRAALEHVRALMEKQKLTVGEKNARRTEPL